MARHPQASSPAVASKVHKKGRISGLFYGEDKFNKKFSPQTSITVTVY